jgi:serine/threonine protein kinase
MTCSQETRQRFLSQSLSGHEETQFELHLETCHACREDLFENSGGVQLENAIRSRLECSKELPIWNSEQAEAIQDRFPEASMAAELASLSPSDDPSSLGRIGLFEAKAILGRGGMGTVYKALDPTLGRTVAIKILRPDLASIGTARHRFRLEAKAMASIAHPHVVPIYAVDDHRGLPYMAMEYVAGGTLDSLLRVQGPFEVLSVIRIAQQIASALHAAHECGLVHRDIKPANILLDRGVDRVRVTDFGLVRVSDDASMTRSGLIAGTPQYMAPEQIRGENCDKRSDLFSLGCVLYALLVGHPPFRAKSPYAAMQRIVHDTPRPISTFRSDVPTWLIALIDRLIAKLPEQRFESAGMLADILESELVAIQNPQQQNAPKRPWLVNQPKPGSDSATMPPSVQPIQNRVPSWISAWQTWVIAYCLTALAIGLVAWYKGSSWGRWYSPLTNDSAPSIPTQRQEPSVDLTYQANLQPPILPPWNSLDSDADFNELYQWRKRASQLDRDLSMPDAR